MNEWSRVPLADVTVQVRDAVDVIPDEEYPLLGVRWYSEGAFHRETVTSKTSKAKTLYRVRPGQFIYNRLFAWKGSFGIVPRQLAGSFVSNEFPLFDCVPGRLLPEYLAYYFAQPALWAEIERLSSGTTASRNRWKEDAFCSYRIPLPSLPEQRRIVDVMAALDAHVESLRTELETSHSLRLHLVQGSDDVEMVPIDTVASVSQGRALPKAVQGRRTGEVSWFKIADMTDEGNVDGYTSADTMLTADEIKLLKGTIVPAGSVVFPRVGAAVLTEKRRLLDVPGALDENHLVLTPRDGVSSEYLLAAFESVRLADLVQTGAVPSLNMGLIRSARIPWSRRGNCALGDALASVRQAVRGTRAELSNLRGLRSTLLSALLTQEVEIPDTYDALVEAAI